MSLPIVGQPTPLSPDEVKAKIQAALPGAEVEVQDLTGTQDHYQVTVKAEAFRGKSLVEQHQMIYAALKEEMKGAIHALALKTSAP